MGAKRPLNGTSKRDKLINKKTFRHTDNATYKLNPLKEPFQSEKKIKAIMFHMRFTLNKA